MLSQAAHIFCSNVIVTESINSFNMASQIFIILLYIFFNIDIATLLNILDPVISSYIRSSLSISLFTIAIISFPLRKTNHKYIKISVSLYIIYLLISIVFPSTLTPFSRYINHIIINTAMLLYALILASKNIQKFEKIIANLFYLNIFLVLLAALTQVRVIGDFSYSRLGEYEGSIFSQSMWTKYAALLSLFSFIDLFDNIGNKILNIFFVTIGIIIMFLAFSKTQIISFIIILMFITFNKIGHYKRYISFLFVLSICVYFVWDKIYERLILVTNMKYLHTFTGRTILWDSVWIQIKKNPLWGYGFGSEEWIDFGYVHRIWAGNVVQSHNLILHLLITIGFVGMAIALWCYFDLVFSYYAIIRKHYSNSRMKNFTVLLFLFFSGFGLSSFAMSQSPEFFSFLILLSTGYAIQKDYYKKN